MFEDLKMVHVQAGLRLLIDALMFWGKMSWVLICSQWHLGLIKIVQAQLSIMDKSEFWKNF